MFSRATGLFFRWGLPLVAVGMLSFATYAVTKNEPERLTTQPRFEPPRNDRFEHAVAAAGLVEPSSENIAIGSQKAGVVRKVFVNVGDEVEAGAPLFELDQSEERTQLAVLEKERSAAAARLQELQSYPRAEEVPPAEARAAAARAAVSEAEANLRDQERQLRFFADAAQIRAASQDELSRYRYAVEMSRARLSEAQAKATEADAALALLKAGTFAPRLAAAEAELEVADAAIANLRATIELMTVRAPIAGRILQRNVRVGEFAATGRLETPLLVMGAVSPLWVRVDVDEADAVRVRTGARAVAFVRGDAQYRASLDFVRFEPMVIPKRALTGALGERVDTRVLQVIFRLDPASLPVFVGQQVDVYIEELPRSEAEQLARQSAADASDAGR